MGRGGVSSVLVRDPPPPPPCPPGPLSCQGSIATGHTYGGAEGAWKIFFIPLAHMAPLPAQALDRGWGAPPPPLPTWHPSLPMRLAASPPPPSWGPSAHFCWGGGGVQKRGDVLPVSFPHPPPYCGAVGEECPRANPPQPRNIHIGSALCCLVVWWLGPDLLHHDCPPLSTRLRRTGK